MASTLRMIPWWQVTTGLLLGTALVLSIIAGREIEAIIVGVLAIPYAAVVGASVVVALRSGWRR